MQTAKTKAELRSIVREWRRRGETVALVPTMGALHDGHISLVRRGAELADHVVASIFVNPTQFGPNEDFAKYPRTEEADLRKCEAAGVDAVFMPAPAEMYLVDATVSLAESRLSKVMCGVTRPIHFAGVLTVVAKLFNIVQPDFAVFGQKDAQQLAIIRRMVRDLDFPIRIVAGEIVREADGLAMSSRNAYLSAAGRQDALCLSRGLRAARAAYDAGERSPEKAMAMIRSTIGEVAQSDIDYVVAVDADSLEPVDELRPNTLIAIAVKMTRDGVRLIDNIIL